MISEWASSYPDGNDTDLFASLLSGEPMENMFFPQFRRVERYVLLRLFSRPHAIPVHRIALLTEPASTGGLRYDPDARFDADVILNRLESHPLGGGFVKTLERRPE